jgi:hypothetical protein
MTTNSETTTIVQSQELSEAIAYMAGFQAQKKQLEIATRLIAHACFKYRIENGGVEKAKIFLAQKIADLASSSHTSCLFANLEKATELQAYAAIHHQITYMNDEGIAFKFS